MTNQRTVSPIHSMRNAGVGLAAAAVLAAGFGLAFHSGQEGGINSTPSSIAEQGNPAAGHELGGKGSKAIQKMITGAYHAFEDWAGGHQVKSPKQQTAEYVGGKAAKATKADGGASQDSDSGSSQPERKYLMDGE
ncbi:hypothetical protein ACIBCO_39695 [Streptomyces violascens]|uniref:hypothetical protein n=1 Tax=Streptomyces violascens TaxID=67381 RepID=UPI003795D575